MTPIAAELVWPEVADARRAVVCQVEPLAPEQWDRTTPCQRWTVRDVVCHLLSMALVAPRSALWAYVGSAADLDRSNQTLVTRVRSNRTDAELVDLLRTHAESVHRPPGLRPVGVLAELAVHAADLSIATGTAAQLSPATLGWTLDYLTTRVPGNTRFHIRRARRVPVLDGARRAAGLQLVATDLGRSWGSPQHPVVEGPADALVLALAGRRCGLDRLDGPGVATLAATWSN